MMHRRAAGGGLTLQDGSEQEGRRIKRRAVRKMRRRKSKNYYGIPTVVWFAAALFFVVCTMTISIKLWLLRPPDSKTTASLNNERNGDSSSMKDCILNCKKVMDEKGLTKLGNKCHQMCVSRQILPDGPVEDSNSRLISAEGTVNLHPLGTEDYDDDETPKTYPYGMTVLDWNPIYRVKEALPIVGDRSDEYALLRQKIDAILPDDPQRSFEAVEMLKENEYSSFLDDVHHGDEFYYDINNCPENPPRGYPFAWNLMKILEHWPADDTTPRPQIHQGLCVFDFTKDYDKALRYRRRELPFIVVNDPAVAKTVERWSVPGYIETLLGPGDHIAEYSENNHFMYWRTGGKKPPVKNWVAPTEKIHISYRDWFDHANVTDDKLGPDNPHWYYRLIGCGSMGNDGSCVSGDPQEYLYDELPYFQPRNDSLYIVDPSETKGIHCRFGMKGVIAENHFDGTRNAIVLLGGQRRYILSHPNQCEKLALYPRGHPSARHSAVDWSNPDLDTFPEFGEAKANEVVLEAGHVLYLPTSWFHFIISLDINFQCNTRSGIGDEYGRYMDECGF